MLLKINKKIGQGTVSNANYPCWRLKQSPAVGDVKIFRLFHKLVPLFFLLPRFVS